MGCLVMACGHMREKYSCNEHGMWDTVQETAQGLIEDEDMARFAALNEYDVNNNYVDDNELDDIHGEWNSYVAGGRIKYCMVAIGTEEADIWENDEENHHPEPDNEGHKYALAWHQLSAFYAWAENHSTEAWAMAQEFEVSLCLFFSSMNIRTLL